MHMEGKKHQRHVDARAGPPAQALPSRHSAAQPPPSAFLQEPDPPSPSDSPQAASPTAMPSARSASHPGSDAIRHAFKSSRFEMPALGVAIHTGSCSTGSSASQHICALQAPHLGLAALLTLANEIPMLSVTCRQLHAALASDPTLMDTFSMRGRVLPDAACMLVATLESTWQVVVPMQWLGHRHEGRCHAGAWAGGRR